jgi:P pilus assembly chaperone PapD
MISHIKLGKDAPSIAYRVSNPSDVAVPLEVEVYTVSYDASQNEILTLVDDHFIVLPPQQEVAANSHQVFRAQLIKPITATTTQAYRIVFKQLAVADETDKSKINMLYNFSTLVFVSPQGATPISETSLDCESKCELVIKNAGNGLLPLKSSAIELDEITYDWPSIKGLIKKTYLMPKHEYRVPLTGLSEQATFKQARFIPKNEK